MALLLLQYVSCLTEFLTSLLFSFDLTVQNSNIPRSNQVLNSEVKEICCRSAHNQEPASSRLEWHICSKF